MSTDAGRFQKLFERWARRIRARMTVRRALTGLAVGLLVGAIAAAVAWRLRQGPARPYMAAAGAVGLIAGTAVAMRRRWTDTEVALYLDGRLSSEEAITTAVELRDLGEEEDIAQAGVVTKAAEALERGNTKLVRPALLSVYHALIPVGAAAIVAVSLLEVPALPEPPPEPGSGVVKVADVEALEKVAELGRLNTPDPGQRERLKKIAEEAKKLREKLAKGMERREALSEIARLRDAVAAERARMSSTEQRAGLEAARGRLAKEQLMKEAAKALGDRDLTRFDLEMQKLANQLEKEDRHEAKKALEEAAEQARKKGADDVAKMLEEQKNLFEERSERGEALREFADAFGDDLPPEAREQLEDFGQDGTDANAGKLAERMADALKNLSPAERKRLGERLRDQLEGGGADGMSPMTKQQLQDLADKLDTPEGQRQLEEMLRDMANEPPRSGEAERDRALGEAEKGLGEAEKGLGAKPMPMPNSGKPKGDCNKPGCKKPGCKGGCEEGNKGPANAPGNGDNASGSPGSHDDKGRGDHDGTSNEVDGEGFRARAGGDLNPGAPMPGVVTGRGKGRPGETANKRGLGGVGKAAPGEVGGVDRSEIPEEYREQIGRYFSP